MSEKRFQPMRVVDNIVRIYDSETDDVLKINDITNKLNELAEENEQLQKELKNRSAFIVDKGLADTFIRWKNE